MTHALWLWYWHWPMTYGPYVGAVGASAILIRLGNTDTARAKRQARRDRIGTREWWADVLTASVVTAVGAAGFTWLVLFISGLSFTI